MNSLFSKSAFSQKSSRYFYFLSKILQFLGPDSSMITRTNLFCEQRVPHIWLVLVSKNDSNFSYGRHIYKMSLPCRFVFKNVQTDSAYFLKIWKTAWSWFSPWPFIFMKTTSTLLWDLFKICQTIQALWEETKESEKNTLTTLSH